MKPFAIVALSAAFLLPFHAAAQHPSNIAKAEMARIAQMQGRWKGGGWIELPSGRHHTRSEETIEMRLDGHALLVDGIHYDAKTSEVVHHALAIIAWDDAQKQYRLLSTLAAGRTGYFPARLEGRTFIWTIPVPNGPTTRFTIALDDPDRWKEVGEQSRDGGLTWVKFFEMNLERVK